MSALFGGSFFEKNKFNTVRARLSNAHALISSLFVILQE